MCDAPLEGEAVAEEASPPRTVYRAFRDIDLQFEFRFDAAAYGFKNPLAGVLTAYLDTAVAGIAAEAVLPG